MQEFIKKLKPNKNGLKTNFKQSHEIFIKSVKKNPMSKQKNLP